MRLLAYAFTVVALGLLGLGCWAWYGEAPLFGLPQPDGLPVATMLSTVAFLIAGQLFQSSRDQGRETDPFAHLDDRERAIWGAKWVIPATGVVAFGFSVGLFGGEVVAGLGIGLVVAAFVAASWLAARFVEKYGDEAGEARFDTHNPE